MIRLIGCFVGIAIILYEAHLLREGKRRLNYLMIFSGIVFVLLGLFPSLANVPAELFSLYDIEGGRLITLLICFSGVIFFLLMSCRGKVDYLEQRLLNMGIHEAYKTLGRNECDFPKDAIWVVIPVLNEEKNLEELLHRIPKDVQGIPVVTLVVDDGSTDNSCGVAKCNNCASVSLPTNFGGGLALKAGFYTASQCCARAVVTIDGDNQHDPDDIAGVVGPIINNESDLVIGSRHLGDYERVSLVRSIGIYVFNFIINILQGTKITDCSSGFRALNIKLLQSIELKQRQYHTAEMIISAAKVGARISEAPISVSTRSHGESKKGGDLFYGFNFLRTIIKTWIR